MKHLIELPAMGDYDMNGQACMRAIETFVQFSVLAKAANDAGTDMTASAEAAIRAWTPEETILKAADLAIFREGLENLEKAIMVTLADIMLEGKSKAEALAACPTAEDVERLVEAKRRGAA